MDSIIREYSSDFQTGESWGYNKFYRIEALVFITMDSTFVSPRVGE